MSRFCRRPQRFLEGVGVALAMAVPAHAGEPLTIRQIVDALRQATITEPADFSGRDMSRLDLSGIDFRHARLKGADLFGSDLSGADFTGADLAGAKLDRTVLIHTNFTRADLSDISLTLPSAFSTIEVKPDEAPIFVGANLRHARILANLAWSDFSGADMTGIRFSPGRDRVIYVVHTYLTGAKLIGARLVDADLSESFLALADLTRADLTGANFQRSDLSSAVFTGAILASTDFGGAKLDGATGGPTLPK